MTSVCVQVLEKSYWFCPSPGDFDLCKSNKVISDSTDYNTKTTLELLCIVQNLKLA